MAFLSGNDLNQRRWGRNYVSPAMFLFVAVVTATIVAGCGESEPAPPPNTQSSSATGLHKTGVSRFFDKLANEDKSPPPDVTPRFSDIAESVGIQFTRFNDIVADRFFLPEIMGGGAGWIDFDNDGCLDLYFTNGCQLEPGNSRSTEHVNRLYRNNVDTFNDVTRASNVGDKGFGQGCAIGDFNGDGFADIFVANFGRNVLYANNGDGTFDIHSESATPIREAAKPASDFDGLTPVWSTSAAWFDADQDDDLDLYVVNYLDVTMKTHKICTENGKRLYCGPGHYEPVSDQLFLNQGDGSFSEQGTELGFLASQGRGLAVSILDLDQDLRPEIYVANDMSPNHLFSRSATDQLNAVQYREQGVDAGCASSRSGEFEASMGIACADFNRDGRCDLFLTHYYHKKNTLYLNLGGLQFEDASRSSKIAATSYGFLGFGTAAFDYDRDGACDIMVANGHVSGPNHPPEAMRAQLLRNDGNGRFEDISHHSGDYFRQTWIGRGLASGDFDNDGDVDVVMTHVKRPWALLRNDTQTERTYLGLDLKTQSRVPPIGGRVVVHSNVKQVIPLAAGGSYLCSSDRRVLIGLAENEVPVDVEVYWPSGRVDKFTFDVANTYWTILEGRRPISCDSND